MEEPPAESNPYRAPEAFTTLPPEAPVRSTWGLVVAGSLMTIGLSFPIAAVMALVYRFPVPFAGYLSGLDAVVPALFAVAFYGILFGGFVVLGIAGAVAAVVIGRMSGNPRRRRVSLIACSAALSAAGLFVLAILDKIIGPW